MELEYHDESRKGRFVILLGVLLAIVAGGVAFYTLNQAQQQAGQSGLKTVPVVVALSVIPPRQAIKAEDVTVRQVPLDPTNAAGTVSDPSLLVGRITAVTILQGQIITTNMLASSEGGAQFSILGPDETVAPDSPIWRAVAITVADNMALGGMLTVGQTVDVFITTGIVVPSSSPNGSGSPEATSAAPRPSGSPEYMSDQSTKITYQNMVILARQATFYIIRAPIDVAEEIEHLQATGAAVFGLALRPIQDGRQVDATNLGQTTNRIIVRYGLPVPEVLVPGYSAAPTPTIAPFTPAPSPSASTAP
jgi:Flp pilus assembly protein CpaB